MPRFVPPLDSLYHRYAQAQRRFTWERVRTQAGIKVLPEERDQEGLPTCIYEAVMAWMQSHLRRQGITVRLSSRDLQVKEQALISEELDRTVRCMIVVTQVGILSEDDYQNQNLAGIKYVVEGCVSFFSLNKQAIEGAVEAMHRGPLLLVFHCGDNYYEYVGKYKGKPILSYETYVHEKMRTHAVCSIGYGVEGFVPNWEFMNSYGKKLGPRGRVLPQNAIRLYGMDRVRPVVHAVPAPAAVLDSNKRKREITDEVDDDEDDDDDDGEPPLKKPMLEKIDWMDLD